MKKNILFIIAIAVLAAFGIVFRQQITSIIRGGNPNPEATPSVSVSPSPSPTSTLSPSVTPQPPIKPAAYRGRPTEELRPVPKEVALFTESEKQEIYRTLQNYGKTVKENPDFFDGWIKLGLYKKIIGDYEGSRDAWEYASIIRPGNSLSFANLGELYWRYLHLYSQAEKNFRMSLTNDPANPSVYVSLSGVYFHSLKEKSNLADDILLEGIAANPQSIDLPKALASLYERQGEYAKAIEWWQKVLAKDPQNAGVAATIEGLKKRLGQ